MFELTSWILYILIFVVQIYGLVLSFKANILLGIIALIVNPLAFIIGIVKIFGDIDLAVKIVAWVKNK